jgi:general secretion pathway protein I
MRPEERKKALLFLQKKKQKNFAPLRAVLKRPRTRTPKVFFDSFLFTKKRNLLSFSQPGPEAGFTLLEVMAAFVIAALGSLVLYQAGFSGTAESVTAAHYQEAVIRAQSRLATIGVLTPLRPMRLSGDDGGGFHWALTIVPDQTNHTTLTLYDVQVTEWFGNRQVALDSKRLGPKQ